MQSRYPGIQFHISSGNAVFVRESLDRGLIDFGIVFGPVDLTKYHALKVPVRDIWGVLMRKGFASCRERNQSGEKISGISR